MLEEKRILNYAVDGLSSLDGDVVKAFIGEIKEINGVCGAEVDLSEGDLTYRIEEWASDYDVLTEVIAVCEKYGLELVLDNVGEQLVESEGYTREVEETQTEAADETAEEKVVDKRREKLGDILERIIVLGLSAILIVIGLCLGNNENVQMWIFMFAFAFSGYEILYSAVVKILKKQYFIEEISVTVAALALLYVGNRSAGCLIMFVYSCLSFGELLLNIRLKSALSIEYGENSDAELNAKLNEIPINSKIFTTKKRTVFSAVVLLIGLLAAFIPPFFGTGTYGEKLINTWLYVGMTVFSLVPIAGLVKSVSLVYIFTEFNFEKRGVRFSDPEAFSRLSECEKVIFDKTGVLTVPIARIEGVETEDVDLLKDVLLAAESGTDHPIAVAVREHFGDRCGFSDVENRKIMSNKGVTFERRGEKYSVGNKKLMAEAGIAVSDSGNAFSPVYVAKGSELIGTVYFSYTVRDNSFGAVTELEKDLGIRSEVVSSDALNVVNDLKSGLGLAKAYSGAHTSFKVKAVSERGVVYVGDSVTDSEVIANAYCAIALNGGSPSADAVVGCGDVREVPALIKSSRRTGKIVRQNIVLTVCGKVIAIALAVLLKGFFGIDCAWWIFAFDCAVQCLAVANSARGLGEAV